VFVPGIAAMIHHQKQSQQSVRVPKSICDLSEDVLTSGVQFPGESETLNEKNLITCFSCWSTGWRLDPPPRYTTHIIIIYCIVTIVLGPGCCIYDICIILYATLSRCSQRIAGLYYSTRI